MASTTRHHATTRADTRSISIGAASETVFEFLSDARNLPLWAVGFCRSVRPDESAPDRWLVATAQGEIPARIVADRALGVVDFHLFPTPGTAVVAHSRVVPNADGAEYVFTQLQGTLPDETFDAQVLALVAELDILQRIMAARAACPV